MTDNPATTHLRLLRTCVDTAEVALDHALKAAVRVLPAGHKMILDLRDLHDEVRKASVNLTQLETWLSS